jgi:ankyrin repeat protein
MTAIHGAAYDGDLATVLELLESGTPADSRDQKGFTPLLWACFRAAVVDQVPVIKALVEAGADPGAVTGAGDASCLMLAVQSGSESAVTALILAGAKLDASGDGVTPLMVAARAGDMKLAKLLLNQGANPAIRCGRFSAADYARYGGYDQLADQLDREASDR